MTTGGGVGLANWMALDPTTLLLPITSAALHPATTFRWKFGVLAVGLQKRSPEKEPNVGPAGHVAAFVIDV
jgi:hypothetical protein